MTDKNEVRLDIAVSRSLPTISRSTAAKIIEDGLIKVNGLKVIKPSFKVSGSDKFNINYYPDKIKIPKIKLPIIYEDNDVIVINKPIGVLAHSKGEYNPEATVASWLADKYIGDKNERSGIVHRLDRLTSGVMVLAKNEAAAKWLQKQFSTRKARKTYLAIVSGNLNHESAIIDLPIRRNPKNPQSFKVDAGGKQAITEYSVLSSSNNLSLVELRPTTGRTHQLRIHLSHLGHPIVGDSLYHGKPADRLYLLAKKLEITLPSKERKTFEVDTPNEFKILIKP
jgi:23S rRNA pseudouridine1911/1915/1917 synthase